MNIFKQPKSAGQVMTGISVGGLSEKQRRLCILIFTLCSTVALNLNVQLHRQEEEARLKAASSHEQYKAQLARTNDARQYYYSHTLPSILKVSVKRLELRLFIAMTLPSDRQVATCCAQNLKDTIDESDLSLQYYLMRYGYMSEDYMMKDATILSPFQGPGKPPN